MKYYTVTEFHSWEDAGKDSGVKAASVEEAIATLNKAEKDRYIKNGCPPDPMAEITLCNQVQTLYEDGKPTTEKVNLYMDGYGVRYIVARHTAQ